MSDQIEKDDEVAQKIIKIVAEELSIEEEKISMDSKFTDDLGADSLAQVEIMMAIENEFECTIPDEEAAKISTTRDSVKAVKAYLESNS